MMVVGTYRKIQKYKLNGLNKIKTYLNFMEEILKHYLPKPK